MWVRENGLYPQAGGAPIRQYCEALDIGFKTHKRWMENDNYSNALKKAMEDYRTKTVTEIVNTLKKSAIGYIVTTKDSEYKAQVVREYDQNTGKKVKEYTTDKGVKTREIRKEIHVQPNVGAAIFLLTNMDPDNWKNKQTTTGDLNIAMEEPPVIMFGEAPDQEAQDKPADDAGE